jgi:hypothetical protein
MQGGAMYAIEFEARVKNGVIEVPEVYRQQLAGAVRVIILSELPANDDDIIATLLAKPRKVPSFSPLKRDEIYERR